MKTTKTNKNESVKNVYQIVTDRIVEQMEQGIIPWQKPWTYAGSRMGDLRQVAINYVTRRPYSMLNQWLLGFRPGEYLSYKQATELGGKVRKGAKAGLVVFWGSMVVKERTKRDEDGNLVVDDEGNEVKEAVTDMRPIPVLKYYSVYHLDDIEGIESKYPPVKETPAEEMPDPIETAEDIIWNYVLREEKLTFQNDKPSDRAYYQPGADTVVVPMLSQYKVKEEYYSTTFHELTHSTMPAYRCDRKEENAIAAFGSENYAREELVAEIGSAMLCNMAGLDCEKAFKNSVAYVQGWLKALKNNPKWIVWASSRAEKAARYIQYGKEETENAAEDYAATHHGAHLTEWDKAHPAPVGWCKPGQVFKSEIPFDGKPKEVYGIVTKLGTNCIFYMSNIGTFTEHTFAHNSMGWDKLQPVDVVCENSNKGFEKMFKKFHEIRDWWEKEGVKVWMERDEKR